MHTFTIPHTIPIKIDAILMVEYAVHRLRHIDVWCRVECWSFFDAHFSYVAFAVETLHIYMAFNKISKSDTATHHICEFSALHRFFFGFSLDFSHTHTEFRWTVRGLLSPFFPIFFYQHILVSMLLWWSKWDYLSPSLMATTITSLSTGLFCACNVNRIGYKW